MPTLIVATSNKDKFKEIKSILQGIDCKILSLLDFDKSPKIIENGDTFLENSKKKSILTSKFYDCFAVADDSGLEVEFLDGKPGVYSARFAGKDCNYTANNQKLLSLLKGLPKSKRKARFTCCVSCAYKGEYISHFCGYIKGYIADNPVGSKGFGYDPVFFLSKYNKTMAQITPALKNKISHRYQAFEKFRKSFLKYLENKRFF